MTFASQPTIAIRLRLFSREFDSKFTYVCVCAYVTHAPNGTKGNAVHQKKKKKIRLAFVSADHDSKAIRINSSPFNKKKLGQKFFMKHNQKRLLFNIDRVTIQI